MSEGIVTVEPGTADIRTKRHFGDVQLHVEWRSPSVESHNKNLLTEDAARIEEKYAHYGMHQFMANSGIFLQERYEIQVLETYGLKTYVNGQAGAVYKQHAPQVNASRAPGEWQTYDIVFQAPRFNEQGTLSQPGRVTVLHNGVLIQNNVAIWGPVKFRGLPQYEAHGLAPIVLQSHTAVSQISYRNIWIREL